MRDDDQRCVGKLVVVTERTTAPSSFADNKRGICVFCAEPVQHRPHWPPEAVFVCRACFVARAEAGDEVAVLPQTAAELRRLCESRN